MKLATSSILGIAASALLFSACIGAGNTNTTNSTANSNTKSNTNVVANSSQPPVNNRGAASPTPSKEEEAEANEFQGELQVGKAESVILYVGAESGDYAAYCFTNDSEAGRAILAECRNEAQCKVKATVEQSNCKVPGLEATLSYSARIAKVLSVKSLGRQK